jgi:hypothetical protein
MGHRRHEGSCRCELCGAPAAVHCAADEAFLCAACDAKVHGANFLASRHRRTRLRLAAAGPPAPDDEAGYGSAASSCVSTADSAPRPRRGARAPAGSVRPEAVLEAWAKRMGLGAGARRRVPPRVAVAAALWWEAAGRGGVGGHAQALRRLEACAHVPARLVLAVAASLARARALLRRAATDAVEGWDECAWAGPKSSPSRS